MSSIPRFYVYILARPNGTPFYVGKGSGRRIFDHAIEARSGHQCHKCNIIRKLWRNNEEFQRLTVTRDCAMCGESFSAITVTAKFCTERCKHRFYRKNKP